MILYFYCEHTLQVKKRVPIWISNCFFELIFWVLNALTVWRHHTIHIYTGLSSTVKRQLLNDGLTWVVSYKPWIYSWENPNFRINKERGIWYIVCNSTFMHNKICTWEVFLQISEIDWKAIIKIHEQKARFLSITKLNKEWVNIFPYINIYPVLRGANCLIFLDLIFLYSHRDMRHKNIKEFGSCQLDTPLKVDKYFHGKTKYEEYFIYFLLQTEEISAKTWWILIFLSFNPVLPCKKNILCRLSVLDP